MKRILLMGALCTVAFAQTVVVPNANTSVKGNDSSGPLPTTPFSLEGQTVYNPGQFPAGQIYITGLTFRAAPGQGPLNIPISGTIEFSTTNRVANNPPGPLLSFTYANNTGSDNIEVLNLTNFIMTGAACGGPAPCPFANVATFTTPFPYNRANGSLLEFDKLSTIGGPGTTGQFDVIDCPPAACVEYGINGPLSTPAANSNNNGGGNITQFTYTTIAPTPIPPSILITMIGLACVGFYVGRRGLKFA